MAIKGGLGRGLGSLIPSRSVKNPTQKKLEKNKPTTSRPVAVADTDKIYQINIEDITPNPHQPRQEFSHQELENLVNSIKEHGILQPIIVSENDGGYELIAGERRLRASKIAGLKKVPVIIRLAKQQEKLELALIENLQRQNLNSMEEADAYQKLADEFKLTQEQISKKVGKSRSAIGNTLRLLSLPQEIKKALRNNKITEGHARIILQLPTEKEKLKFLNRILKEQLSVHATEQASKSVVVKKHFRKIDPNLAAKEEELRNFLGSKVNIKKKGSGGNIIIEYYSEAELSDIISKII